LFERRTFYDAVMVDIERASDRLVFRLTLDECGLTEPGGSVGRSGRHDDLRCTFLRRGSRWWETSQQASLSGGIRQLAGLVRENGSFSARFFSSSASAAW
jgi:hypothetical protein